jgi:hypothetical protein
MGRQGEQLPFGFDSLEGAKPDYLGIGGAVGV